MIDKELDESSEMEPSELQDAEIEAEDMQMSEEIDAEEITAADNDADEPLELSGEENLDDEFVADDGELYDADELAFEGEAESLVARSDDEEEMEESAGPRTYSSTAMADSLSLSAKIEAILFASSKCMKPIDILEVLEVEDLTVDEIQAQIDILVEAYAVRQGGFRLESVRGHGYQFRTVAEAGCYMERLFASRPRPLSRAALETLSIVAYRQPVSRADIEHIRGVDSGSIVKNLLERSLIRCVGRNEEVAGKPMVFGTTDEFLAVFRLNSLNDLPPLASFQPPHDMVQSAEDQLEGEYDELLDEEHPLPEGDFVGVEGEDEPEISEGVLEDEDGLTAASDDGGDKWEAEEEVVDNDEDMVALATAEAIEYEQTELEDLESQVIEAATEESANVATTDAEGRLEGAVLAAADDIEDLEEPEPSAEESEEDMLLAQEGENVAEKDS